MFYKLTKRKTQMSNINLVTANNFKSTAESRKQLISLLSYDERKMFLNFIKSVDEKLLYSGK